MSIQLLQKDWSRSVLIAGTAWVVGSCSGEESSLGTVARSSGGSSEAGNRDTGAADSDGGYAGNNAADGGSANTAGVSGDAQNAGASARGNGGDSVGRGGSGGGSGRGIERGGSGPGGATTVGTAGDVNLLQGGRSTNNGGSRTTGGRVEGGTEAGGDENGGGGATDGSGVTSGGSLIREGLIPRVKLGQPCDVPGSWSCVSDSLSIMGLCNEGVPEDPWWQRFDCDTEGTVCHAPHAGSSAEFVTCIAPHSGCLGKPTGRQCGSWGTIECDEIGVVDANATCPSTLCEDQACIPWDPCNPPDDDPVTLACDPQCENLDEPRCGVPGFGRYAGVDGFVYGDDEVPDETDPWLDVAVPAAQYWPAVAACPEYRAYVFWGTVEYKYDRVVYTMRVPPPYEVTIARVEDPAVVSIPDYYEELVSAVCSADKRSYTMTGAGPSYAVKSGEYDPDWGVHASVIYTTDVNAPAFRLVLQLQDSLERAESM